MLTFQKLHLNARITHGSIIFFLLVLTGCQFFSSKKENKDPEFPKPDTLTVPEREFAVSDDSDKRLFEKVVVDFFDKQNSRIVLGI